MNAPPPERNTFPTGLYPIIDPDVFPHGLIEQRVRTLCKVGVGVIQVRVKTGGPDRLHSWTHRVISWCQDSPTKVLVNDAPEIAAGTSAHGVHLGQDDCPVEVARGILGPSAWIGLSTHSLEEVLQANGREGSSRPDYIGFGPIFQTQNRSMAHLPHGFDGLTAAVEASSLPIIAIGGVKAAHLRALARAGAHGFAAIGSLCAPNDQFDAFLGACSRGPERFRVMDQ